MNSKVDSISLEKRVIESSINSRPLLYTKIYPNPTEGRLNIEFVGKIDEKIKITFTNSSGILLFSKENITEKVISIDISNYPNGVYFLSGVFGDNYVTEKIILKK